MKAIIFKDAHRNFAFEEAPDPVLKSGEVLVQLKAAALNHRDVWIMKGQYPGAKFPSIPGSDGAGVVVKAADDVNPNWMHQEVIINAGYNWGSEQSAFSNDFKILGLPDQGTFAEKIAVPMTQLAQKPKHLSFEQAAALPLAGLTAFRALFSRAKLASREPVLITGIGGGVALFALQFAVATKSKVFVTSSSQEKLDRAIAMGAQGGANYREKDWVEKLKKEVGGFSVIVDSAGGDGFNQLIDLAAPGGRIVFFGGTQGVVPQLDLRKVFWKQLNLLGTTMGSPTDFQSMLNFTNEHQIVPIVHSVSPLAEAKHAFELMEKGGQFGKLVLKI